MPDAIITSTASTFGTISGTFAADQSTITGTVTGIITGTLDGSVGVPGVGVPDGGTTGQVLQKATNTSYDTVWATPSGGAWGTITGTLSNQTDLQTALNLKAPLASPSLTGVPTAPTAATLTSTTQLATTAFVQQELLSGTANAKNLEVYVRNQTGATLTAGTIVYINGATGNRPTITKAQANNDANSAQTFGFVKTSIANNGFGYVIVRGELENVDTSALTEGVQLYLSPTTAGTWTTTKPSAPQHLVYVGICVRAHPTQGVILVAVQNGYELNELHDVQITSPTNGQVLKYNSSTSLWYNGLDVGIPVGGTAGQFLTKIDGTDYNTDWTTVNLSAYAVKANNLSDLTNFATARDNLGLGTLSSPTFAGVTVQGSGANVANLTPTSLSLTHATSGSFTIQPSVGITFPDASVQTTAFTGIPAGYITSVSSPLSVTSGNLSVDLSAYLTSATAATSYYPLSGNPSSFLVAADIAGKADISGATFTGLVNTVASTTTTAGLRVPHGSAPTSPVNGDIWTDNSGLLARINGTSQRFAMLGSNNTFTGLNFFQGANLSFGTGASDSTIGVGTGSTLSGFTKAVNIGTSGGSGSTTNITIGSTTGTSTTTLQGTTNGVTQSAGDSSLKLATTAFVTTADNLKANLASPTFTGTPLSTTAAVDTNTTQIATTAFVVGQGYLKSATASSTYYLQTNPAGYITSAALSGYATESFVTSQGYITSSALTPYLTTSSASATYFTIASAANKADLASPALTGAPTAPTAAAATNTTQIATTAFVQQEVPAASTTAAGKVELATNAEVIISNSSSLVPALLNIPAIITRPENRSLNYINSTAISGSGAASTNNSGVREIYLNSLATGRAAYWLGVPTFNQTACLMSRANNQLIDFSKKIWLSGKTCAGFNIATNYMGDANTMCRITLGGYNNNATGDMTGKGFGWKKVGGTSPFFTLTVHNGTSLTDVATTVQQSDKKVIDWVIYSDGAGNVTLYIDGAQAATTSAGPTGLSTAGWSMYREQVEATATPGVRGIMHCTGGNLYTEG